MVQLLRWWRTCAQQTWNKLPLVPTSVIGGSRKGTQPKLLTCASKVLLVRQVWGLKQGNYGRLDHSIHGWRYGTVHCEVSLRFNGHFPGEPGLAGVYWSKGWWDDGGGCDNWTTGAISRAKLQSNHHHQQTNIQFFTDRMPFLPPNQQCQSTEWKISHSMDLLTPSSPGGLPTFSLITYSSWLPWGGLPCLLSALWCQYHTCTTLLLW